MPDGLILSKYKRFKREIKSNSLLVKIMKEVFNNSYQTALKYFCVMMLIELKDKDVTDKLLENV